MKLATVKTEFEKYIVIKDRWVLDVVLGTIAGNAILDRDPIWTMITAPSSGGKSTFIAPAVGISFVHFIDDMTEKTLLSGFKIKGKETSLLKSIGSGIMAFSDFTSILSKNPVSRGEILTQLKLVYDRKISKRTGMGAIDWEGKIGFIGAATPDIYSHLEAGRSMGERFIYYWLEQPTDEEIADKQAENSLSSKEITEIMKDLYRDYVLDFKKWLDENGVHHLDMTANQRMAVRQAASFCVNGKATVHQNQRTGKVDQIPNKAGVGRDNKQFEAILHITQLMDAYEANNPKLPLSDDRVAMVEKMAYSAINREKRKILEILIDHRIKYLSSSQIGTKNGLGMDKESVEMYLQPLHAVGLINKQAGNPHTWYIADNNVVDFIRRVSATLNDVIPTSHDEDVFSKPVVTAEPVVVVAHPEQDVFGFTEDE